MKLEPLLSCVAALGLACVSFSANVAQAAPVTVATSGGFAAAYRALVPEFECKTGDTLVTDLGPSMGDTHDAVPARLERGEPIDVVIMVGYALDALVKAGQIAADSRVDLAHSFIGIAVRSGTRRPDINSVAALRRTLLAAKSIAYSDSASGVYIQNEMFKRLGIVHQIAGKTRMIPAEPVGNVVARGEAEIGFQQISELKPIAGIDLVGPIPSELQQDTIYSGGIVAKSHQPLAAFRLLQFLASSAASAAIKASGMEPIGLREPGASAEPFSHSTNGNGQCSNNGR
jgi:molybdate transport system substrate-binding protein